MRNRPIVRGSCLLPCCDNTDIVLTYSSTDMLFQLFCRSCKMRLIHGEFFEFRPEGKLLISTNKKPQILGRDEGIWRRVRLIPFKFRIPDKMKIGNMEELLLKELPGILNWAIKGCLLWQTQDLYIQQGFYARQTYRFQDRPDRR